MRRGDPDCFSPRLQTRTGTPRPGYAPRGGGGERGQSQVPGGRQGVRRGAAPRKAAARGKQCVPSRKPRAAHAGSDACGMRLPAGEGEGAGGQGLPRASGWQRCRLRRARGGGRGEGRRRVTPKGTASPHRGRREEEGDLFKLGGWASERGKKKKRKRKKK